MAVTMEEVSEKEIEIRCVCNQASNRCTRQVFFGSNILIKGSACDQDEVNPVL